MCVFIYCSIVQILQMRRGQCCQLVSNIIRMDMSLKCKPSKKDLHLSVGLTGLFSAIGNSEQCTATKIPFVYSFSGNCAAFSLSFHIHVSVSDLFIYSQDRVQIFSCSRKDRSIVGIYKLLRTHECGNWHCGREISFLGIFVSNLRYCVLQVA